MNTPVAWSNPTERQDLSKKLITARQNKHLPEDSLFTDGNLTVENMDVSPQEKFSPNSSQTLTEEGGKQEEETKCCIERDTVDEVSLSDSPMSQVTSVSQLSDVQPTDWAYQALQSLVERYGAIAGYSDSTFRGNRAMTRYEFAAGLNAALDRVNELVTAGTVDRVKKEDLEILQKLREEFATELVTLRSRVDTLEASVANLKANQFTSSTTILGGEVILGLSQAFGGGPPGKGESNAVLTHLTRLQTTTTFNGKDRLRLELDAGNFEGFGFGNPDVLNTNAALLSFQADTDNRIKLSSVDYRFAAFGDRVVFTFRPVGFSLSSVLTANSPYFDSGRGTLSRFAEASPIFKIGDLDAGFGFDWLISKWARFQFAYGARNANNASKGFLFGEDAHALGAQLLLLPGNSVLTGLTFVYGYSPDGRLNTFTGSAIADASGFINQRSNIYAVNGTLQWRLNPQLTFATWGGVVGTYAASTDAFAVSTTYLFSLGYSDPFGREGDLLAVLFGQPPKLAQVGDFSGSSGLGEGATSYHFEAFYRLTVSNNISITPGFFIVTNPGNIENNNTIYVGTIRTTFRF
ncbi:iron uptake porin [Scytonema sp. NUACC26]|uniref:iron uptake porin n=1 Tax=Scytonema sp. NUACC26 TaxID=3140176 RepID=UPI0038B3249D